MKKVLMGNHSVSYGATLARSQVIAAYPITPQTQVVERLSEMVADGDLDAEFIKVESEHSAMAACIGASAAGARAFTATSAQGLLLMHEVLQWASRARLPIVMANINRALAPGWTIWTDQNDSLSQRDTGWIQFYAGNNQEVLDSIILGFKVAEKVSIPFMIVLDAFVLSHTYEPVDIPDQDKVDKFLPPYKPEWKLDVNKPRAFGGLTSPDIYMEFQYNHHNAMVKAKETIEQVGKEFGEKIGRPYGLLDEYKVDDAEYILITSSTTGKTANIVVDKYREKGIKLGNLRVRIFRPFPGKEIYEKIKKVKKVFVIDRNISFGHSGIFFEELKASLYNKDFDVPVFGFVAGLGGRDITPELIENVVEYGRKNKKPEKDVIWMGVNK